jgi:hypothetical protein
MKLFSEIFAQVNWDGAKKIAFTEYSEAEDKASALLREIREGQKSSTTLDEKTRLAFRDLLRATEIYEAVKILAEEAKKSTE